jgi:hypothetical protein
MNTPLVKGHPQRTRNARRYALKVAIWHEAFLDFFEGDIEKVAEIHIPALVALHRTAYERVCARTEYYILEIVNRYLSKNLDKNKYKEYLKCNIKRMKWLEDFAEDWQFRNSDIGRIRDIQYEIETILVWTTTDLDFKLNNELWDEKLAFYDKYEVAPFRANK